MKRIIVAITGATGVIYGIRLLEFLSKIDGVQSHLILSPAGLLTIQHETRYQKADLQALADISHSHRDFTASVASGSFQTHGMAVAPCSMNTLAAIAHGLDHNLISRAASVTLKERRPLVLLPRETPLHLAHLRNMTAVTEMGGIIAPPVPAFYQHPRGLEDIVDQTVGRTLDALDIDCGHLVKRWEGLDSPNDNPQSP